MTDACIHVSCDWWVKTENFGIFGIYMLLKNLNYSIPEAFLTVHVDPVVPLRPDELVEYDADFDADAWDDLTLEQRQDISQILKVSGGMYMYIYIYIYVF